MNDKEIWKTYPPIEWLQGSNLGNVRTLDRCVACKDGGKRLIKGHILPQQFDRYGYMYVTFGMNGKIVHLKVHRVVAKTFLPNPDNLPQVNHIDNDPTNNRVENLEWCTPEYNIEYREKYGTALNHTIIAINLKTLEASRFLSQNEAARQLGADQGHIKDVIKGKRKTHHNFWFTNADNNAVENTRAKLGNEVAAKVETLLK